MVIGLILSKKVKNVCEGIKMLTKSGSLDQTWLVKDWVKILRSFELVSSCLFVSNQLSSNLGEISITELLQIPVDFLEVRTDLGFKFSSVNDSPLEILESSELAVLTVASLGWSSLLISLVVSDELSVDALLSGRLVVLAKVPDNVFELGLRIVQRFHQLGSWLESELFGLGLELSGVDSSSVDLLELVVKVLHSVVF